MADRAALSHLRHELRTPLNHVIGYSEMLLEDAEGAAAALVPALRRIHDDARQILGLINDVLAPSILEAGAGDLARLEAEGRPRVDRIIATAERLRKDAGAVGTAAMVADVDRISTAGRQLLAIVSQAARPATAPPPAATAPGGEPSTILVVDDNEGNREMLSRRLERQGYRVAQAAGGQEALEALAAAPADLVLLDVIMPGMSGHEVLQRLKQDPALREIPVLIISALDEIDSVVRGIELGAEDYLTKPFDPVLLKARVGACLEKKRLRDQEVRHQRELADWNRTLERRVEDQVAQVERLARLTRFFSPALAEAIVSGGADDPLKTHRREVTVVFLDLRGFTAFAETAEPEEVMGVLREYHAGMGRLVLEHEGTLERFTGDGMMIFFNDPTPVPNPAERAVRMAVAMRERVRVLEVGWRKRGYDLAFGVGIAQGYATIGAIGFEGRWDYGAIGTVTNLAARLCGEARGGQILVSSRVAAAVEGLVETAEVGALALKGLSKPVPTFDVTGLR
ncbi:MAG: response regulator [Candidatus Rokubacteria bacterium]|nr:response regulator [Candidatus Rokubacteria bacterium]MBI3826326.1 response regulator [Candidatus Rokubacteria bacterium]